MQRSKKHLSPAHAGLSSNARLFPHAHARGYTLSPAHLGSLPLLGQVEVTINRPCRIKSQKKLPLSDDISPPFARY